jgi:hypothetical protein
MPEREDATVFTTRISLMLDPVWYRVYTAIPFSFFCNTQSGVVLKKNEENKMKIKRERNRTRKGFID